MDANSTEPVIVLVRSTLLRWSKVLSVKPALPLPLWLVGAILFGAIGALISSGVAATSADAFGLVSLALGLIALYFAMHTDVGVGRIELTLIRDLLERLTDRIKANKFDALPQMERALQDVRPKVRDADRSVMEDAVRRWVVPAAAHALKHAPAEIVPEVWDVVEAAKGLGVDVSELNTLADRAGDESEKVEDARGGFVRSESDAASRAVADLASRYNTIRETERPGRDRTSMMTAVVRQLEQAAARTDAFDWQSALNSDDRGMRLAAYAYLYVRPQRGAGELLIQTLLHLEDKPFGQYWALQALHKVVPVDESLARFLAPLRAYERTLARSSDRARECRAVINLIEAKSERRV